MGTFDSFADAAFQLKTEGETIVLNFKQGVPVSGQGTVSWNIPAPAHGGCDNEDGNGGAYAGMVILLSTTPLTAANIPQNGTVYHADPTADTDMHTGDKVGGALVVGAIYECETKGQGGDLTTSLVITDLDPNTSYYVAGYATDCQYRYHSDGVRAYSDEYGNGDEPDTPGRQVISFGSNRVLPTDGTDLVAGVNYAFDLVVDRNAPNGTDFDVVEINVDGLDVGTYDELIAAINNQIKLAGNPPQSPVAPNTGAFFWDAVGQTLYQWDGSTHVEVPAIVEATDPTNVTDGEYWYDTDDDVLYLRATGAWTEIATGVARINHIRDPRTPTAEDFWFDGTTGRSWNGSIWCDVLTSVAATDPSVCEEPENGTYWYDTVNGVLGERNTENKTWETRAAITWDEDPSNLSRGTYWFDLNTNVLSIMAGTPADWAATPVTISETAPAAPSNGDLWYVESTEQLFEHVGAGSPAAWEERDVLVWPGDPTDTSSCDLWWRTTDDTLFAWDSQSNAFVEVVEFIMSDTDPALAPVIVVDSLWWDGTTLKKWDGSGWEDVDTIVFATDPTNTGSVWHDTANNLFYNLTGSPSVIDTINSANDPTSLPANTYWFNTTDDSLNMYNGVSWVNISYTTVPLTPTRGDLWFDTANSILYEWNGTSYVEIGGIATAAINSRGQIVFTGVEGGSSQVVLIPVPEGASSASSSGCASIGTGYADFGEAGVTAGATCSYNTLSGEVNYPTRDISTANFLWDHVMPTAYIQSPTEGVDGLSGLPSYDVLGVGDDGTPDERRELADSLRAQLGYPVVDVELTPYQIDTAIQGALESLRKRSSAAYKRGFFFLDVRPGQSNYVLNNKRIGYNKIVNVTEIRRFTSAFLSTAHGAGVYGQVVLQHLYNMGTYDLTSFHLVSQYVEQLEHLFATRIVFNWSEEDRQLNIFQSFTRQERLLLDCTIERTEQDLLKDRYVKSWLERYALSECQFMLAQIRGKYTSLPGAGGGISLNAAELTALAESNRAELIEQIDDYIVNDLEGQGQGGTFVIG